MKKNILQLLKQFKTELFSFLAPKWIHNLIAMFTCSAPNEYMISYIYVFNVHLILPQHNECPFSTEVKEAAVKQRVLSVPKSTLYKWVHSVLMIYLHNFLLIFFQRHYWQTSIICAAI